jgi:hypothetical protein
MKPQMIPLTLLLLFMGGRNAYSQATVEGKLILPEPTPGREYWVLVDEDVDGDNGFVKYSGGVCGSETAVSFTISDVPAGTYYIYAGVRILSHFGTPPEIGDYVGIYGGTIDEYPRQPNAVIPASGTVTFDIIMSRFNRSRPARGYWSGYHMRFSVSADGSRVCGFYFRPRWPDVFGACGLISEEFYECSLISLDGHFEFGRKAPSYLPDEEVKLEGVFTSTTTVTGTWNVGRNFLGWCTDSSSWSASPIEGGPFACNQVGSVEICVWLNNPTPTSGYSVLVYGQLLDGGIGQNGLPVHVVWRHGTATGSCDGQTGSNGPGLARCSIGDFDASVDGSLVIDLTIRYGGQDYTASASFPTAIEDFHSDKEWPLPEDFQLSQNYPNPFNSQTLIKYELPKESDVLLEIYNVLGELVKTLVNKKQTPGHYSVQWDGKNVLGRELPSGVYLYRLQTKEFVKVKKLLLLR